MIDKLIPVRIAGVGYSLPETVITNDDLTKLYETSDEWIYTRTGIKERRVVSGEQSAIDLGLEAAQRALQKAKINPDDIDLIVAASSAPPDLYPAIACHIHQRLEIKRQIPAFDITAACSGLIYAMSIAKAYIASGMYKNILLVATDNNSRLLDWTDRSTSILFGDGAGAMVLTPSEDGVDDIIAIDITADGNFGHLIELPFAGQNCPLVEQNETKEAKIKMNGRGVYTFVAKVLPHYVENLIANANLKADDIDYLIPHQANIRIIQAVQERLGYSDDKVVTNIKYYGNTSAASIPIALAESVEKGNVKLGSTAILCGFGAGMTLGGAIVRLREGIC
jgi:3-oxoacyl-[acyl-carrier-protein] synthase-3